MLIPLNTYRASSLTLVFLLQTPMIFSACLHINMILQTGAKLVKIDCFTAEAKIYLSLWELADAGPNVLSHGNTLEILPNKPEACSQDSYQLFNVAVSDKNHSWICSSTILLKPLYHEGYDT